MFIVKFWWKKLVVRNSCNKRIILKLIAGVIFVNMWNAMKTPIKRLYDVLPDGWKGILSETCRANALTVIPSPNWADRYSLIVMVKRQKKSLTGNNIRQASTWFTVTRESTQFPLRADIRRFKSMSSLPEKSS
jgi:hypothetical protein